MDKGLWFLISESMIIITIQYYIISLLNKNALHSDRNDWKRRIADQVKHEEHHKQLTEGELDEQVIQREAYYQN